MSAALEPEADPLAPPSEAAERVGSLVGVLPAIDLAALESGAALLTRVDRKYVVPMSTFERLVASLSDEWRALEIDGRRLFGYASTYFDTPDLHTYRAHLQRRRRRFKVRVRRYADSDGCMLEVKRKGLRGLTVKERTPHPPWCHAELGPAGRAFVAEVVRGHADLPDGQLRPVVTTTNRRATIASLADRARVTVDTDLSCGWGDAGTSLRGGYVLLESKVEGRGASPVDRLLRSLGERPLDISKYCVGVASLGLDLPTNPWRRTLRRYFENPTSSKEQP
jgi:hypothetical protein